MSVDIGALFPGVAQVPGVGFVQSRGNAGPLGDDASVMMISGLGKEAPVSKQSNLDASGKPVVQAAWQLPDVKTLLAAKVKLWEYEVPVWVLLLIVTGALGVAGWYFFVKPRK